MNRLLKIRLNRKLNSFLGTALLCAAVGIPQSYAEFDPVNDDTDIFLANPAVESQRPNILLYLDNTANWGRNVGGQAIFINEKKALVSTFRNVDDSFNVGLSMFVDDTAQLDASGSYNRFAVRQTNSENRNVLADLVENLDIQNDRSNNNTLASGTVEIYRYFAGKEHRQNPITDKADYANNSTHPATQANLGDYALDSPAQGTEFNSPIADTCQSSFLIYVSNGPAQENNSSLEVSENELASLGYDTSSTISISPSGQQGNWFDEWARFMANADVNPDLDGVQNVYTYTIEVDPQTSGQGPDMTALLKSAARQGKGKYFAVSSANAGQAIVNALNEIFQEVQAVNSVFASTTLPVSVNVRGTNLNQVYIGVFRPDAARSPRWFGNLKMYRLGFDEDTGTLFLEDAAGSRAENPETGFITSTATSFWTKSSSYWDFRTADENGAGGSSDLPDGDLVEKGGAAQQQRIDYDTDQSVRDLYTCTGACTDGSSLSATPFDTSNADITTATLQLDTRAISTLTGFESQDVATLSDTKPVEGIAMVDRGHFLDTLAVTSISQDVNNLTAKKTNSIDNLDDGRLDQAIDSLTHPTTGPPGGREIVTAVINAGHGLSTGDVVTISGANEPGYNGTFVITKQDDLTFTYDAGPDVAGENSPASGSPIATTTSTIITATVPGHGFADGGSVTISGVSPTSYNGTYSLNKIDDDTFSFTVSSSLPPIDDFSAATAAGATKTATATLTGHGYADGSSVVISGASPDEFNGTKTISVVDADTFTYPLATAQGDASGTIVASQGSSLVTATTSSSHNLVAGQIVTIAGAEVEDYNGVFPVENVPDPSTFIYDAGQAVPSTTLDADAAVFYCDTEPCTLALAVVNNHGLAELGSPNVVIEGAADDLNDPSTSYNGNSITIDQIPTKDSFAYDSQDGESPGPAFGDITMRVSAPTAFANVPAHGYADGETVTIRGADKSEYNGEFTITFLDDDNFAYTHNGSGFSTIGDASGTITANVKTTTARARAVAHGFVSGNVVEIAGASPADFNGNFTVTKVDDNNFEYDLTENGGTEQGDASGTIVASTGTATATERDNLIAWVRGTDNFEDENVDGDSTDVRSSIHGDVLHSRPAVINYNRHDNDDDVYVYYGSNDGIFRAVKGGFSQSAVGEPLAGHEAWGFIPEEFFPKLQRMRNNEPKITSANKKPYFADGVVTTLTEDNNGDGKLDVTTDDDANPDRVYLYTSMRRGGRFIYALDVSDPADPKLLWQKSFADSGYGELGFTWSAPSVTTLNTNSGKPVLVFGAGYDPTVEDVPPDSITAMDDSPHTTVTAGGADYVRGMGRGIFVVDAETGDILWQAGPSGSDPAAGHHFETVPDMDFSIPSDVTVISDRSGSIDNRAYVGDTGGNIWRVDMDDSDVANWQVTKLASIADHSNLPQGARKFLFPPDVVYSEDGYDAVLIGSGDREHPFDETVVNRFYMFKDCSIGTSVQACYKDGTSLPPLTEADLFDATDNCIQNDCDGTTQTEAANALTEADGWYITLGEGEKTVGTAVTLNNVVFFNTNQPSTVVSSDTCTSDLGVARQYEVQYDDATALLDQNIDGSLDALDRSSVHPGGGYLPSPVPVVVEIDGKIHEGVISGVAVKQPPGSLLNARLRKFWHREFE